MALRGDRSATAREALAVVAGLAAAEVIWVSSEGAPPPFVAVPAAGVRRLLGRSADAVVVDLHEDLDADVLGQVHGFVRGGGALVLRLPAAIGAGRPGRARLAAWPYTVADVGVRFDACFEGALERGGVVPARRLGPADRAEAGSSEQASVVRELTGRLGDPTPSFTLLMADRGRGKSSALGLALAALGSEVGEVVVTAGDEAAAAEVFRFAQMSAGALQLRFVAATAVAQDGVEAAVIVVDEAAQLPVPVLQRIVARHPRARIAFATTTRGYEGTGRGFMLRFLAWLEGQPRPLRTLTLSEPIRWVAGDALERFVFEALMLDVVPAPAELPAPGAPGTSGPGAAPEEAFLPVALEASGPGAAPEEAFVPVALDRDALVADRQALGDAFGLLVHAHYRTTPEDLHRILDAPNLALHGLRSRASGRIVAVTLLAHEGGLPAELCEAVLRGRTRLRAHALPDALVSHLGHGEAGALRMVRSVRIAVHPEMRRYGLATRLVDYVHRTHDVDLFGTVFGATAELLTFRRSLGYELVRVSASRGARTGEPAALMVRPVSAAARSLVAALRAELACDLPLQLALFASDGELLLDPRLTEGLVAGLGPGAPLSEAARDALVAQYVAGPRTFESVVAAVSAFVAAHEEAVLALAPAERALVVARVARRQSWPAAARAAGMAHTHAAMRGLRRAMGSLWLAVGAQVPGAQEIDSPEEAAS